MTSEYSKNDAVIIILSVGDAHRLAPEFPNSEGDRKTLKMIAEAVISDSSIVGDNADYHNLAATYAQIDDYLHAFNITIKGLRQYPYDCDLLADAIKYGSKCGKVSECKTYLNVLLSRPFEYWNWRTFTFVIDFYLLSTTWDEVSEIQSTLDEALAIARKYQEVLVSEERGYVAEAEVYLTSVNVDKAMEVLHKAIYENKDMLTPQCCIKYADLLSERGEFERVIDVCNRGLIVSAQDQPTARTGYFCYLSALAKDALIHRDFAFADEKRIYDVYSDYKTSYQLLTNSVRYIHNIEDRTRILSAKSGIPCELGRTYSAKGLQDILGSLSSIDEKER